MREDISGNLIVFGTDQVQNDTRTTVILGDQYVQTPVLLSNPRDTVNQVYSLIVCLRVRERHPSAYQSRWFRERTEADVRVP